MGKLSDSKFVSPLLLFGLALAIRLVYALQINFPPLDDPAYYIQAARSLSGPRPLDFELSIIWNFHPLFDNVRHPAMEFWMPLSSFLIGFSMWLLGDHFFTAQLPSLIAGALLPVYTYYFARRFLPLGLSIIAGLIVTLNPLLAYQSALPDSSMLYAALVCPALLMLGSLIKRGTLVRAVIFGLLVGLAYLARTPAVFLALTYFGFWILDFGSPLLHPNPKSAPNQPIFQDPEITDQSKIQNPKSKINGSIQNPKSKILVLVFVVLGMALPVGGWSLRNFLLFGFISSPAGTQTIFLFDYQDLFNYRTPVNLETWLAGGPNKIIGVRLEALWSAWRNVLDVMLPPTALLAGLGLAWLAWREKAARPAALYSLLLFLGMPLVFAVASLNGSYYHSAGSSAPFLVVGEVYLLWSGAKWLARIKYLALSGARSSRKPVVLPAMLGLLVLFNAVLLPLNAGAAITTHRQDEVLYGRIKNWLADHPAPAVITNQPATLNYISGQPAIRLPANEDLSTLQEVAHKYNASYIILTEQAGRYPALLDSPTNTLFPLVYQGGDFEIFAVP